MKFTAVRRIVGAMIIAIATAIALLIAVEFFSSIVHPFPPDFKGTKEEMCRHVERYPTWVLAAVVPMWGFTAIASTWLAGRLGNRSCALFVSLLLLAALLCNIAMLPYPLWFKIVMPIVLAAAAVSGILTSTRRATPC